MQEVEKAREMLQKGDLEKVQENLWKMLKNKELDYFSKFDFTYK